MAKTARLLMLALALAGCGSTQDRAPSPSPTPSGAGGGGTAGGSGGTAGPSGAAGAGAGTTGTDAGAGQAGAVGGTGGGLDAAPEVGGSDARPPISSEGDGDFTINPPFRPAPELTVAAGVPRGTLNRFTMSSTTSTVYPSDVATGATFTRDVWVYVPSQYVRGTAAPFMVVQDGGSYTGRVTPVLDNLINSHQLPVMIAVFINPGPGDGMGSERGLEYDTVSEAYLTFVETEVLPRVKTSYNLTLTADPDGRATMGGSSGGTAAFTMAWFRPDLYRRVLTYSGSFVALHADATYPHGAWEYHEHLIPAIAAKPLRVFLEAGQNDNNRNAQFMDTHFDWLAANRAMSAALEALGYHSRFIYAVSAVHVDDGVIRQTLPETLLWLWRGYGG